MKYKEIWQPILRYHSWHYKIFEDTVLFLWDVFHVIIFSEDENECVLLYILLLVFDFFS